MKKYYTCLLLIFLLVQNQQLFSQLVNAHQSQRPPINPGYPIIRGMYVDCADEIIYDISNGNPLGLKQDLVDYIQNNFIRYIILCGLEHSSVFGNPQLEASLRNFMITVRASVPGIQIGLSGSDALIFQNTPLIAVTSLIGINCIPYGSINNINDLNYALNNSGLYSINQKRSELCKFFLRAAQFGNDTTGARYTSRCRIAFDNLYLEYRYWNQISSLSAMQDEFSNYKTLLSVMQILKCNYNCIRNVDAEFLPNDLYRLQGWTAIDQITDADTLADRLMIPTFTRDANGTFDQVCKTFHFLSDRFSKTHSKIFPELSAESPAFNYCNSSVAPQDFLGDYLNGTANPSGNMYSVEKMFLDKFNDSNYMCQSCSCRPYADDHYSSSNIRGNAITGIMWTPYSMLKDHNLFRVAENKNGEYADNIQQLIQLIDINGRIINNFKNISESNFETSNNTLAEGIYFLKTIYSNGKIEIKKIFINHK